ncbi:MAG: hypothetical protein HY231_19125 [Acidobacteria bacterium]|nr:hypothetical protein [Acidobacteriota bacterium]
MNCPLCNFENVLDVERCAQCDAALAKPVNDSPEEAMEKVRRIAEDITKLTTEMQEKLIPARTTSFNGCGVMLLDYRPVEGGDYEVTRWVTLFGFPLIPLGVWRIRPRHYERNYQGERQSFYLLDKRRLTLSRCVRPYLFLALGALPFLLAYFVLKPVMYAINRALGSGSAVALTILLIIAALVWIGFIMTRFHNVEKAYQQKTP